jgi:hypothetical protein
VAGRIAPDDDEDDGLAAELQYIVALIEVKRAVMLSGDAVVDAPTAYEADHQIRQRAASCAGHGIKKAILLSFIGRWFRPYLWSDGEI